MTESIPRKLSPLEEKVFAFMQEFIAERQFAPSIIEIQTHFGFKNKAQAYDLIRRIESKGFIRRDHNRRRSVTIAHPVTSTIVRVKFDDMNYVEFPRETFPDEAKNLRLVEWDDLVLVVSSLPPRHGDTAVLESPMLKLHLMGTYIGNKRFLTDEGHLYGADPLALRRVMLVLQAIDPTL